LPRTESTGEKKGEEREREREKEREGGRLTAVVEPSTALMAGDIVVIEADPWDPSDVSVEMLQSLVDDGLLRPITDPDRPEWIAPLGEPEPRPPAGYVVSFVSFHERGLGVPADRFMRALPHYYGVELHNFNPNSIAQAAIFVAVCEGYLGIAPHWELWLHLFRAGHTTKPTGTAGTRKMVRAGGYTL